MGQVADQVEWLIGLVQWLVGSAAFCAGAIVNLLCGLPQIFCPFASPVCTGLTCARVPRLLHHILTEREKFNPRSVLYFLCVSTLLFMYIYPPASDLKDVLW